MTTIHFVRHGETVHNVGMVITSGKPGAPLNDRGIEQVHHTAQALAFRPIVAIYASPLLRAHQSATIIGEGLGLDVQLRDELVECDVGSLEGRTGVEAFELFDATFDDWYLGSNADRPLGLDGELGVDAIARVRRVVQEAAASHPGQEVVIVGHGTILQLAITWMCSNLEPPSGFRRWIPNAGIVTVQAEGDICCTSWAGQNP